MTVREMRASWRRLLFFFICLSIGVGAIVAIRSVIQSVRQVFAGEARALITADAIITSNRAFDEKVDAAIDERLRTAGASSLMSVEVATMVRGADTASLTTRMVELRAVERGFPYYGEMKLAGGQRFDYSLLENFGVLVRPELLAQLKLAVGDAIRIGTQRFTIRGVIEAEPGRRLGAFSMGPRVFISYADLGKTGLLSFGSRASFQRLVKTPDASLDALVTGLRQDFTNTFARVRSYKATEDDIGEDFTRAENYLSLVGLVIVILGGIGVSSVTRVFVQQKIRSIAILKCLGGRSGQLLTIYMVQLIVLGLAGSAFGVLLAALAIASIPSTLAAAATPGIVVDYSLTGPAVVQGFGIGLLVSVLFSLVPLLEIRHVKPSLLLRAEETSAALGCRATRRDRRRSRRARRPHRLAGRIAARRRRGRRRLCRDGPRAPSRGYRPDLGGSPAGAHAMVRAAPRGAAIEPAGKPGAHRAPRRRSRQLLHRRRALAAGESRSRVHGQPVARSARHVPARRAAGPGGRHGITAERVAAAGHAGAEAPAGAARAGSPGSEARRSRSRTTRTCAAADRWRASTR